MLKRFIEYTIFLSKACPGGHYGLSCAEKCVGQCKDQDHCNHTTGVCDNGCADGWTGGNCTDGCSENSFFCIISYKKIKIYFALNELHNYGKK